MNEVVQFLQENPVQYLATVGTDGKAKCRPFMFAGALEGKLGFVQTAKKMCTTICKQIQMLNYQYHHLVMHGFD